MIENIKYFLEDILPFINKKERSSWIDRIKCFKKDYPLSKFENPMHPTNIIPFIANNVPSNSIIVTDVGEHQMWTAQRYPFKHPRTFLTSGGLGTMGFGLPTAIGAALENKDKLIICFTGDGSLLMNIQELATLKDLQLNIKIIILNNHHLGLVRQQQELFYHKHFIASEFISNPNFKIIAEGFGISSCDLSLEDNPLNKLKEILSKSEPYLINILIDETENVLPMVYPGDANIKMIGGDNLYD